MTTLNNTNNKSIKGGIDMDTLINAWTEYLMETGFDRLDAYAMAYRKVVRKGIKHLPHEEKSYARMVGDGNHMKHPHFIDEGDTHH